MAWIKQTIKNRLRIAARYAILDTEKGKAIEAALPHVI